MTSRHPTVTAVGFTQASSVRPVVGRSVAASGTVTRDVEPSNASAFPNLADVVQLAPVMVPALAFPEASPTVIPAPSSNEYAATSDGAPPALGVGEGDELGLGDGVGDGD